MPRPNTQNLIGFNMAILVSFVLVNPQGLPEVEQQAESQSDQQQADKGIFVHNSSLKKAARPDCLRFGYVARGRGNTVTYYRKSAAFGAPGDETGPGAGGAAGLAAIPGAPIGAGAGMPGAAAVGAGAPATA